MCDLSRSPYIHLYVLRAPSSEDDIEVAGKLGRRHGATLNSGLREAPVVFPAEGGGGGGSFTPRDEGGRLIAPPHRSVHA